MLKYCYIIDEETGLVQLGEGCDEAYYIEIGMKQRDVEQSEKDFLWYLTKKCPHYTEEELAKIRENDFKSKFFNIEGIGWYRRHPKGYQSAIESLNTAFNNFVIMQKQGIEEFPAGVFIFYIEPDYTKPEECTEEWLIEHQFKNQVMTAEQFGAFYTTFTNAWNAREHK